MGRPPNPPHLIKEKVVKECAKKFSVKVMVETGTFLGDMVSGCRRSFKRIYSVELDRNLYEKAKERFSRFSHILIIHGENGEVLPRILAEIEEPCLFWLDAHAHSHDGKLTKGKIDPPILFELDCIFKHPIPGHIILIDDAHDFVGKMGFPYLEELGAFLLNRDINLVSEIKEDIIHIYRRRNTS